MELKIIVTDFYEVNYLNLNLIHGRYKENRRKWNFNSSITSSLQKIRSYREGCRNDINATSNKIETIPVSVMMETVTRPLLFPFSDFDFIAAVVLHLTETFTTLLIASPPPCYETRIRDFQCCISTQRQYCFPLSVF